MKATLTYLPQFRIEPTAAEVKILIFMSSIHYDHTCRSASDVGGFLYGWHNMTRFMETEREPFQTVVSMSTLDICGKILEGRYLNSRSGLMTPEDLAIANTLKAKLDSCYEEFNKAYNEVKQMEWIIE